ncbi:MAG: hypothetical protein HY958_01800 [Bacteroidia bacterium]|nr:hypothetical protein [Bacteroidia bacterium]
MAKSLLKIYVSLFLILSAFLTYPQEQSSKQSEAIDLRFFNNDSLAGLILQGINKQLAFNNHEELRVHKILKMAAEDQAEFMAEIEDAVLEQGSQKKKTTEDRMIFYGGSVYAQELVTKEPLKKGDMNLSYKELAYNIVFKWQSNKKNMDVFLNPDYIFIGIGCKIDKKGKKLYVSAVLGNYKSLNAGANRRGEMDVPYTTRLWGLMPFEDKICRKCNDFRNMVDLQKGLSVRDGFIYFKCNRLKNLTRLLRDPKDGIAVEVVQKDQYPCTGENIVDNNLVNKGIIVNRMWSRRLFKKNLNKDKKRDELEVKIGKFPEGIKGEYELNLLIIKEQRVCRNIARSYVIDAGLEYSNKVELLADTITISGTTKFEPSVTSSIITFKIPFEKSKVDYKSQDVEPLLKQLKEPDYIINEVKITAYSSIEGSEERNAQLQKDRAQSILKVLESRQKTKIIPAILTKDNWELFQKDIKETKYADLADKTLQEAQDFIRENKIHEELEPILAKERYAEVVMKVTYDIGGEKEQPFAVSMFNKAVKRRDLPMALSVQKFIFKKVLRKKYNSQTVTNMDIPLEKDFAGLLMNKLWLERYVKNSDLNKYYYDQIGKYTQLDPSNPYILYNYLYCEIVNGELGNEKLVQERQKLIDGLYSSTLSKPTIDNLNIEYQFKIIHAYDSLATPHPKMVASLEKIKKIVNVNDGNWQSSLKLAYMFIAQKDYDFAIKLVEPFIEEDNVFDELVFTYIALCSKTTQRLNTSLFLNAMKKAKELDFDRFCKIISDTRMTFQIFENTDVKELYCKTCKGK